MAKIVFVNDKDEVIGAGTKEEAWKHGNIFRSVKIFIFNTKGELLIQKRSLNLANFPGKWDMSVGGHVDEGGEYMDAAVREIKEEVGIESLKLQEVKKYLI